MLRPVGPSLWRGGWNDADLRLANLEGPIVEPDSGHPADKPILIRLPAEQGTWLRALGVSAVSLANNHMLDWGPEPLDTTFAALNAAGVAFAGAGKNRQAAEAPLYLTVGGHRVALLSFACTIPPGFRAEDSRPGIAGVRIQSYVYVQPGRQEEQPGTPAAVWTRPLDEDVIRLEKRIAEARERAEIVLLSVHWGVPPQYRTGGQHFVTAYQEVLAERAARAGADAILGHHPHAPNGFGVVQVSGRPADRQVPVVYSMGNYIFHPEYVDGGLRHQGGPYERMPKMRPENRETCVVTLVCREAQARLEVVALEMYLGVLDAQGEAATPNDMELDTVASRISAECNSLGTVVSMCDGRVVWRR